MSYSEELIQAVWEKAIAQDDNDATMWRKDECGAWMQRVMYGDRDSQYGWEIDQISPKFPETISNLCPLHWKNRIGKSDGRLICSVTSSGIDNKELIDGSTIKDLAAR
ncbi:MAG: hypothetical protein NTU47_12490 [Ignavibacteriales bacterium]|nr:hypothetical protein [Ignavibacteriales bacterium]